LVARVLGRGRVNKARRVENAVPEDLGQPSKSTCLALSVNDRRVILDRDADAVPCRAVSSYWEELGQDRRSISEMFCLCRARHGVEWFDRDELSERGAQQHEEVKPERWQETVEEAADGARECNWKSVIPPLAWLVFPSFPSFLALPCRQQRTRRICRDLASQRDMRAQAREGKLCTANTPPVDAIQSELAVPPLLAWCHAA
jgi:hypothetical protein